MKSGFKNRLRNSRWLRHLFKFATLLTSRFSIQKSRNNRVENNSGLAFRCHFRIHGSNNKIIIDDFARVIRCKFYINGNNNVVHIGKNVYMEDGAVLTDFDCNQITIGNNAIISRGFEGAAMEGTEIAIGEECLFSSHISIRTCDSHSIINEQGERINQSQSVRIGKHVWVGVNALFLKGALVSDDSVVAARSVITKPFDTGNVVIAGQPAKIVKRNVNWDKQLNPLKGEKA